LDSIINEVEGGLSVQWKTFSLEQQNTKEGPDFMIWEDQDYPSQGFMALVAAKAALKQGEAPFLRFHRATFKARHDEGKDIGDIEVLKEIAQQTDLDLARFEQDVARDETWQAAGEDHAESKEKYRVFGVPTLVFEQGEPVFVKLQSIPESREERLSLFELISDMGAKRPYLLELKRP
jgi:predicted DsbA family dithiol-disulfide isomerase